LRAVLEKPFGQLFLIFYGPLLALYLDLGCSPAGGTLELPSVVMARLMVIIRLLVMDFGVLKAVRVRL